MLAGWLVSGPASSTCDAFPAVTSSSWQHVAWHAVDVTVPSHSPAAEQHGPSIRVFGGWRARSSSSSSSSIMGFVALAYNPGGSSCGGLVGRMELA